MESGETKEMSRNFKKKKKREKDDGKDDKS